jgi:hypothetical protein
MGCERMPDDRLVSFYDSIREQAEADRGQQYKFMGPTVRQYADQLRDEMIKRRLTHRPIDWLE